MIHVVCGAPCSGKTTYVKNHAKDDDVIVDADKIAQAFGSTSEYMAKGNILDVSLKSRKTAIDTILDKNLDSWIIDTNPSEESLKRYREVNAEIINLDTDMNECIKRALQDYRPKETIDVIKEYFKNKGEKIMGEFKHIETQEQLDAIIGERLRRQAEQLEKRFAGFVSPEDLGIKTEGLNTQIAELSKALEEEKAKSGTYDTQIAELTNKVKTYERDSIKNRVSAELGLPFELANRITGDTEEEIRKDAENLKSIFGRNSSPAPLLNNDDIGTVNKEALEMKEMLRQLKGE